MDSAFQAANEFEIKQPLIELNENYEIRALGTSASLYAFRSRKLLRKLLAIFLIAIELLLGVFFLVALSSSQNYKGLTFGALFLFLIILVTYIGVVGRRNVQFFSDLKRTDLVFGAYQDQLFPLSFGRTYSIRGHRNDFIGQLVRPGFFLLGRQWKIFDSTAKQIAFVKEDSVSIVAQMVGRQAAALINNFSFFTLDGNSKVAHFEQVPDFRDRYLLKIEKVDTPMDRRLLLAQSILLDTGESK